MSSPATSSPTDSQPESLTPPSQHSVIFHPKNIDALWDQPKHAKHFSTGFAGGNKEVCVQVDTPPTQSEASSGCNTPVEEVERHLQHRSAQALVDRPLQPPRSKLAENDETGWFIHLSKAKLTRMDELQIREAAFLNQHQSLKERRDKYEEEFKKAADELKEKLASGRATAEAEFVEKAKELNKELSSVAAGLVRMETAERALQRDWDGVLPEGYDGDDGYSSSSSEDTESTDEDCDPIRVVATAKREEEEETEEICGNWKSVRVD